MLLEQKFTYMNTKWKNWQGLFFCFCFLILFKNSGITVYLALEGQSWGSEIGTGECEGGGRVQHAGSWEETDWALVAKEAHISDNPLGLSPNT